MTEVEDDAVYDDEVYGSYHVTSKYGSYVASHESDDGVKASPLVASGFATFSPNVEIRGRGEIKDSWNKTFQEILEISETSEIETITKYRALVKLSADFVEVAKTYGKVIISESTLPNELKTIKPSNIGGVAGGKKYIVRGILFKLAEDQDTGGRHVYGGNEPNLELAAKSAGHDLKGAINYLNFFHEMMLSASMPMDQIIRVPLQCLVDYRGYRLIAMPLLPLKKIIYGSNDGGRTVHNEDNCRLMELAAEDFHLGGHLIHGKLIHSAADVECNRGTDDRVYALDLARTFPPESPLDTPHLPKIPSSVFFRMIRPELLRKLKHIGKPPLSADAFTNFCANQTDAHEHNLRVRDATKYLLETVIPDFAKHLVAEESKAGEDGPEVLHLPVSEQVHKAGVNIRHIGLLRSLLPPTSRARVVLFIEMVGRVLKNMLRAWQRGGMSLFKNQEPSEYELKSVITTMLNLVSGFDQRSAEFWKSQLLEGLTSRFGTVALSKEESDDLLAASTPYMQEIVTHTLSMTGMELTARCQSQFGVGAKTAKERRKAVGFNFSPADIRETGARVKHISLVDFARGKLYFTQSMETGVAPAALSRLQDLALFSLTKALETDTLNYSTIRDQCKCQAAIHEQGRNFKLADETLIQGIVGMAQVAESAPKVYDKCVIPLLDTLLTSWRKRRGNGKTGLMTNTGGATSLSILHKATQLLETFRKAHTSDKLEASYAEVKGLWSDRETIFRRVAALLLDNRFASKTALPDPAADDPRLVKACEAQRIYEADCANNVWEPVRQRFAWDVLVALGGCTATFREDIKLLNTIIEEPAEGDEEGGKDGGKDGGGGGGGKDGAGDEPTQRQDFLQNAALKKELLKVQETVLKCMEWSAKRPEGADSSIVGMLCELFVGPFATKAGTDKEGDVIESVLAWAIDRNSGPLIQCLLLCFNADVNKMLYADGALRTYESALARAVRKSRDQLSLFILQNCHPDVDLQNQSGRTALMEACVNGDVALVQQIFDYSDPAINITDFKGETALSLACIQGSLEVVQILLSKPGIKVNSLSGARETPLMHVSLRGNLRVAQALIAAKADVNILGGDRHNGGTALHHAANGGDLSIVKLLLAHRADPTLCQERVPHPLTQAAAKGQLSVLEELLKQPDVDPTRKQAYGLGSALVYGAEFPGIVRALLAAKVPPFEVNLFGGNTLYYASAKGSPESAVILAELDPKMMFQQTRNNKRSPLLVAALQEDDAMVTALTGVIKKNPDTTPSINLRDRQGFTALMYAVKAGKVPMARELLEAKADPNITCATGQTALDFVKAAYDENMASMLETATGLKDGSKGGSSSSASSSSSSKEKSGIGSFFRGLSKHKDKDL